MKKQIWLYEDYYPGCREYDYEVHIHLYDPEIDVTIVDLDLNVYEGSPEQMKLWKDENLTYVGTL